MERSCKVKENDGEWPSENDDSGDSMFLIKGNSLIQDIRSKPRDLFLENLEESEEEDNIDIPDIIEKVEKMDNKPEPGKINFILEKLQKYKKADN